MCLESKTFITYISHVLTNRRLLRDGTFSDMTVVCKDRTWKCHRNYLCVRCPFFNAACNGDFKVGIAINKKKTLLTQRPQEAKTQIVNLDEDDPEGVDVLLEYLYTLTEPTVNKAADKKHVRAEQAFIMGDKYGLGQLKTFGREKLYEGIQDDFRYWDKKTAAQKMEMVARLEKIWSWQQLGSAAIRDLCLKKLGTMSDSMLEDDRFMDLVWRQRVFGTAFMKYIFSLERKANKYC